MVCYINDRLDKIKKKLDLNLDTCADLIRINIFDHEANLPDRIRTLV